MGAPRNDSLHQLHQFADGNANNGHDHNVTVFFLNLGGILLPSGPNQMKVLFMKHSQARKAKLLIKSSMSWKMLSKMRVSVSNGFTEQFPESTKCFLIMSYISIWLKLKIFLYLNVQFIDNNNALLLHLSCYKINLFRFGHHFFLHFR